MSKNHSSSSSTLMPKQTPKGVTKSIKYVYESSSQETGTLAARHDHDLQSLTSKRRYMRRGSKAPSMFMRSGNLRYEASSLSHERDAPRMKHCRVDRTPAVLRPLARSRSASLRLDLPSLLPSRELTLFYASAMSHQPQQPLQRRQSVC